MTYVLLMVFASISSSGGMVVVKQEFNNFQACETARIHLSKIHQVGPAVLLKSHGCFAKGESK
jgi:hypothetical protein